VAPNIFSTVIGDSRLVGHVTILVPRIWRKILDFLKTSTFLTHDIAFMLGSFLWEHRVLAIL